MNCESGSREDAAEESSSSAAELHGQCTANQFRCSNGRCIDKSLECNRKYDCDDGTDETSCGKLSAIFIYHPNTPESTLRSGPRRLMVASYNKQTDKK